MDFSKTKSAWLQMRRGFLPDKLYSLPEWSDNFRVLSGKASAEPGPWDTDRVPYTRQIMEDLSVNSGIEIIIWMKGAQIAGTEIGNNWIGYCIDRYPSNILYVMPTLDTLKRNVKIRINPLLEDTPCLREKVASQRSRDGSNTLFNKEFDGGSLIMTGANSAVGLKSLPARYIFLDEVEAYPDDLDGEGDPVSLATARTKTFGRKRKIYIVSTPKIKQTSKIEPLFEQGDQNYYHVPCPKCKKKQPLVFQQLKYQNNDPNTVKYECEFCKKRFVNDDKELILRKGIWIPKKKSFDDNYRSYHINSLYSPVGWYGWKDIISDWLKAQGHPLKLKAFLNTVLAKTWEERGEAPDWEKIYNRRGDGDYYRGEPPDVPMIITAGVDIQANRIELEKVGFAQRGRNYSLDYKIIPGDTADGDVWEKLIKELHKPITDRSGNNRRLLIAGVDSGHETTKVYQLARDYPELVLCIKGDGTQVGGLVSRGKPIEVEYDGKAMITGVSLYTIAVNIIKTELYSLLRINNKDKSGYQFFPKNYDEEYFRQLTSESLKKTKSKITGRTRYLFIKNSGNDRNEALDCRVYARAVAEYIGYARIRDEQWDDIGNLFHDDIDYVAKNIKKQVKRKRVLSKGI